MDRECLKGWLLAPSPTDKEYVPYFIYVRDKDIIWDEKNLPEDLKRLSDLAESKEIIFVNSYWNFSYKDWRIKLYTDGRYEAKKRISIGEKFDNITESHSQIKGSIDLPFSTLYDDEFMITITTSSSDTTIKTALSGFYQINDEIIDKVTLYLENPVYIFSSNFKSSHKYDDSYLFIKIEGNVEFEDNLERCRYRKNGYE